MNGPALLGETEITTRLGTLQAFDPGWRIAGNALRARFEFADFVAAFGFMTEVALVAERMQHHPDWTNVWKHVSIALSTHAAGGITELDFMLAKHISQLAHARLA